MSDTAEVCAVSTICGRDGVYIPMFFIRYNNQIVRLTDDDPCDNNVKLVGFDTVNCQVEIEVNGAPKNLTYSPLLARPQRRSRM